MMKMKAIVLAGGVGKRMFPITTPKCLIKFLGKELILHKIDILRKAGVDDIIIVGNPFNVTALKNVVDSTIRFATQEEPKGMADAILSASPLVDDQGVLIINSEDIIEPGGLKDLFTGSGDSRLMGCRVNSYFPGGYFKVKGDKIVGMVEKPGQGNEPSDLISIGVYYHRKFKDLIEYIDKASSSKDDIYEVAMDMMMKDGYDYRVSQYDGAWIPLKYPWNIWDIMEHFYMELEGRKIHETANIHPTAVIDGKVIIEKNVRIFENSVVRGPCFVGEGSVIGNNSLIWGGCHIGKENVIGYSTELKNCYTGENVWFHQNYLGDSIIMDNCSFGAKTITANFRFDEENICIKINNSLVDTGRNKFGVVMGEGCRTGIMAGLMPGLRIGAGSFLGPQTQITKDVNPDTCILLDQKHHIFKSIFKVKTDRSELKKRIA